MPKTKSKPAILFLKWDKTDLVITCPFNEEFVHDLKRWIHANDRWWDPAEGVWRITRGARVRDIVEELGRTHFADVVWEEAPGSPSQPTRNRTLEQSYNELFTLATLDELHLLYRTVAKRLHPDRQGGNEEKIRLLNEAWDWLKKPR